MKKSKVPPSKRSIPDDEKKSIPIFVDYLKQIQGIKVLNTTDSIIITFPGSVAAFREGKLTSSIAYDFRRGFLFLSADKDMVNGAQVSSFFRVYLSGGYFGSFWELMETLPAWLRKLSEQSNLASGESPLAILDNLKHRAKENEVRVNNLVRQINLITNAFEANKITELFTTRFPGIKCQAHSREALRPRYVISGFKIFARSWQNKNLVIDGYDILPSYYCGFTLDIQLFISHDLEEEVVDFDDKPEEFWNLNLSYFRIEKGELGGVDVGYIYNDQKSGFGLIVSDFSEFEIFTKNLKTAYEAIGLDYPYQF